MSEMVERVRVAINQAAFDKGFDPEVLARAAIAAMREPTEAMIQATCDQPGGWSDAGKAWAKLQWQAMIDRALKE